MTATDGGSGAVPTDLDLSRQGRALGDPTRYAIFERIRRSVAPVRVAELTAELGCNHNAVRQHLAKLRAAGLVVEEKAPRTTPGRPAWQYRLAPGAVERWSDTSPHEELALMLVRLLHGGDTPRALGSETGARLADGMNAATGDPVEVLVAVTRRMGFAPRRVTVPAVPGAVTGAETAGRVHEEVVLEACPFAVEARIAPEVVCELHRGLAEGVCRATGGGLRVDGLDVGMPERDICRLRVSAPSGGRTPVRG